MGAVRAALHVVEQLASHRTAVAIAVSDDTAASDSVLAWYGAGRPTTLENLKKLSVATQDASSAVSILERLVTEVADAIRAAGGPAVPVTIGAQELWA